MTSVAVPESQLMVQAQNLYYLYPKAKIPALDGLNLSVAQGEIFGLLGPNGVGKTTALSILSTLFRPHKGVLFIGGLDAYRQPEAIRKIIGLIPQDLALYPAFTLKENLIYFGKLHGLTGEILTRRVSDCLEMVELTSHGHRQVKHVSGGMKRRCNIAAALIHNPRILLLDEPTVGVDIHTRKLIFEHLAHLRSQGMTMIYTTHYMEDAEQLCDRITIMDRGKDLAHGTPQHLVRGMAGCRNLEALFLALTGKQIRD